MRPVGPGIAPPSSSQLYDSFDPPLVRVWLTPAWRRIPSFGRQISIQTPASACGSWARDIRSVEILRAKPQGHHR
jgi:hypothetical protein